MQSTYTQAQLEKMPPEKAARMRYVRTGSPEPGSGVRDLSPEEIFELCLDPRFQAAVAVCEQVEGHEKAVRGVVRSACKAIHRYDMHAREQKKAIELAARKCAN